MSEEEKKAIEHLTKKMDYHKNKPLDTYVWLTLDEHYVRVLLNLIEKQQEQLKEKDKIITEMAKYIKEPYQLYLFKGRMTKLQAIIEYFTKKAREV